MKKLLLLVMLTACGSPAPVAPTPVATVSPVITASACLATDQDGDVYHPDRLKVLQPCLRVSGTVLAKIQEADGDYHIRVLLDSQFSSLVTPANQQQCAHQGTTNVCGLLVVEPVCVNPVSQTDAISTCAADADPLKDLPSVGQHVWLEGRYVLDLDHGSWAELHPLYRWGVN